MMILVVLRFGTAMAVIDEYLIFGGFNRASPTYTLDDLPRTARRFQARPTGVRATPPRSA